MFPFQVSALLGSYVITVDQGAAITFAILVTALLAVAVPYLATLRQPVPNTRAWHVNGIRWATLGHGKL